MMTDKPKSLMLRLLIAGYPKDQMFHHESDLYVYVTPLSREVIMEWCKENGYRREWHCPVFTDQITGKPMFDCAFSYSSLIEKAFTKWNEFTDVPMDAETECIESEFEGFPAGTHREEIWHWFEETFGIRVYDLLYGGCGG